MEEPNVRKQSAKPLRSVMATLALAMIAVVGGPQTALADGGQSAEEGYVMVQQALSFLVNDPGPTGLAQALAMVDDALAAEDQDGVDLDAVETARVSLEAGDTEEARSLLQGSISRAIAGLKPAVGEETGTTVVLAPLQANGPLSGLDWLFLAVSVAVTLVGVTLSYLFRPSETLGELRTVVLEADRQRHETRETISTRKEA